MANEHQTTRRVWSMPEIPPDVTAVRDAAGSVWRRSRDGWTNADVDFGSTGWLIASRGPVSEVTEVESWRPASMTRETDHVTTVEAEAARRAVEAQRRTRLLDQLRVEAREMLAAGKTPTATLHHVATALWGQRGNELFPELTDDYPQAMLVASGLVEQERRR